MSMFLMFNKFGRILKYFSKKKTETTLIINEKHLQNCHKAIFQKSLNYAIGG